jgi:hypothetical protein
VATISLLIKDQKQRRKAYAFFLAVFLAAGFFATARFAGAFLAAVFLGAADLELPA